MNRRRILNSQLSTPDHIRGDKEKAVTIQGEEYSSLFEDAPHAGGQFVLHVLPAIFAEIYFLAILLQACISCSQNTK